MLLEHRRSYLLARGCFIVFFLSLCPHSSLRERIFWDFSALCFLFFSTRCTGYYNGSMGEYSGLWAFFFFNTSSKEGFFCRASENNNLRKMGGNFRFFCMGPDARWNVFYDRISWLRQWSTNKHKTHKQSQNNYEKNNQITKTILLHPSQEQNYSVSLSMVLTIFFFFKTVIS